MTGYKQGAHAVECGNYDPADRKFAPLLPELLEYLCRGGEEVGAHIVDVGRADQYRMHDPQEYQRQESPGVPGRNERPAGSLENQHEVELVDRPHDHDHRRRHAACRCEDAPGRTRLSARRPTAVPDPSS